MGKADTAAAWCESIALNDAHGYDQANRWGPDYDCSSLVISAYERAGVPVKSSGATYTGNMFPVFIGLGFVNVYSEVNVVTGAGLQRGDVLLNVANHTAIYIGSGKLVQASINERGGVTGGQPGDQTGGEINIHGYYNFPWDYVLRYNQDEQPPAVPPSPESAPSPSGLYTVKKGDTLWGIAERHLGDGMRYTELMKLNSLVSTAIYPGEVLHLPERGTEKGPTPATVKLTLSVQETTAAALRRKARAEGISIGEYIDRII